MSSVQIYTNTSNAHFATTTGNADGTRSVLARVGAAPLSHLIRSTKPDATAFPNSLFIGSSLNYLRIKLLVFSATPTPDPGGTTLFHIYGWSQEASTRYWEARKIATLAPDISACATSSTFTMPGLTGSWREIFQYNAGGGGPPPIGPIPTSGEAKIYNGDSVGGGGFFLIDTIGTEMVEIHITTTGTAFSFAALCAGL
jgi:hypothetical protein